MNIVESVSVIKFPFSEGFSGFSDIFFDKQR